MKCKICDRDFARSDGTETIDYYFVCKNCCSDASKMKLLDVKKYIIANTPLLNVAKRKLNTYASVDNILFYNLEEGKWYIGELGEKHDFSDILYVDYNEYLSEEYTGIKGSQKYGFFKAMIDVSFSHGVIDDMYLMDKETNMKKELKEKNLLVNNAIISIHLIDGQIYNYKLNSIPFYFISKEHDSIINASNYIKNVVLLLKEYYYADAIGLDDRKEKISGAINDLKYFSCLHGERKKLNYSKQDKKDKIEITEDDVMPIPEGKKQCPICLSIFDETLDFCPKCDFEF